MRMPLSETTKFVLSKRPSITNEAVVEADQDAPPVVSEVAPFENE